MIRLGSLRDVGYNTIDYLSTLLFFLITTRLFISEIGTDGYGFYMLFTSFTATLGLFDLGIGLAVSKYLSEYIHSGDLGRSLQVITHALVFYFFICAAVISCLILGSDTILGLLGFDSTFEPLGMTALVTTVLVFAINVYITVPINILVAYESWGAISLLGIVFRALNAIALILIITSDVSSLQKLQYVFHAQLIISITKLFGYYWVALRQLPSFRLIVPSSEIRSDLFNFMKWSSIQYGFGIVVGNIDRIIISKLFGLETLGVYSFVANVFIYLYGFVTNVFKITYPKLSRAHGQGGIQIVGGYLSVLIFVAIGVALIVATLSITLWSQFIGWYITDHFAKESFLYLIIFMIYLVVRAPEVVFHYFFNAIATPKILVLNVIIGSCTTVSAYFLFVPKLNEFGVVLAQILGSITVYICLIIIVKVRGFNFLLSGGK